MLRTAPALLLLLVGVVAFVFSPSPPLSATTHALLQFFLVGLLPTASHLATPGRKKASDERVGVCASRRRSRPSTASTASPATLSWPILFAVQLCLPRRSALPPFFRTLQSSLCRRPRRHLPTRLRISPTTLPTEQRDCLLSVPYPLLLARIKTCGLCPLSHAAIRQVRLACCSLIATCRYSKLPIPSSIVTPPVRLGLFPSSRSTHSWRPLFSWHLRHLEPSTPEYTVRQPVSLAGGADFVTNRFSLSSGLPGPLQCRARLAEVRCLSCPALCEIYRTLAKLYFRISSSPLFLVRLPRPLIAPHRRIRAALVARG